MSADRRHRRPPGRPPPRPEPVEPEPLRVISCKLSELLRFTETDFAETEALHGEPDGLRMWWHLRRVEWAEQDREASYGRS